jgi:DNA-binding Lrp family transcriptional regulator
LDKLDLGILKALLVNNSSPPGSSVLRKSFRSMAKELKVDQGTIRKRIRKFREHKVLKGWYLGVSPSLTSQDVVYAWLQVEPESGKARLIERLSSLPDVERVCNYLGPKLSIVLLCKKGANPVVSLKRLQKLTGPSQSFQKQAVIRLPENELKATDAAIVSVLRRDPLKPYPSIASELGLSAKTVKRRVTRLTEGGEIYMIPILDLKALEGIIPMELVVGYTSPGSKSSVNDLIVSHIKEKLVFSERAGPFGYFALIMPNISQVEQIAKWVKQQKGVRDAHSEVLLDVILNRKHYELQSVPASRRGFG